MSNRRPRRGSVADSPCGFLCGMRTRVSVLVGAVSSVDKALVVGEINRGGFRGRGR